MKLSHLLSVVTLAAALAACGGGSSDSGSGQDGLVTALAAKSPAASKVTSVTLVAPPPAVIGTPLRIVAEVKNRTGAVLTNATLVWSVSDTTVAKVDAAGTVTPLRAGVAKVSAASGTVSGSTLVSVRGTTPIPVRSRHVGINLTGIAFWTSQFAFADLMKNSTGWSSIEDNGTRDAAFPSMTTDGYPAAMKAGQHAISFVSAATTHRPVGRYVALWDGDGTVSFPWSNVTVAESSARRMAVDVSASGELWVSIDTTSASNPVRNLRLLAPGTEATYATQPFNAAFLQKIAPFSTLRFMDWGATNDSPQVQWADRPLPSHATWQAPKGVPLELMIELANTLHVDPWFCIPHQASDDYVTRFATMLRDKLDPTLRPHIEYSNEVWNTGGEQNRWAVARSAALGLPVSNGQPAEFYATRAVQVFKLVQQAYGPADAPRIVRVLAGQSAWTYFLEKALTTANAAANADVLAIAPYVAAEEAAKVEQVATSLTLTSDQVVDQMLANLRGEIKRQIVDNAALAAKHRLTLKAYEGGSGNTSNYFLTEHQDAMTALFTSANRNPRMRDLYMEFYSIWRTAGGDTLNQYTDIAMWSKNGSWGALEYASQDPQDAPKYRGLLDFIAAHPTP